MRRHLATSLVLVNPPGNKRGYGLSTGCCLPFNHNVLVVNYVLYFGYHIYSRVHLVWDSPKGEGRSTLSGQPCKEPNATPSNLALSPLKKLNGVCRLTPLTDFIQTAVCRMTHMTVEASRLCNLHVLSKLEAGRASGSTTPTSSVTPSAWCRPPPERSQ